MIELGRLCVKIAGRDAGLKCVVVDILKDNYVLIDGETRRRKCNVIHLEPLDKVIKLKKNPSHNDVKSEFKKLGLAARDTKPKQAAERPKKTRKTKIKKEKEEVKQETKEKKPVKKEKPKKGSKKETKKKTTKK